MGKKTNKIRVRFVGENATDVTGSCVLIETETKKILVECGLFQGENTLLQQYRINNGKFRFKVKELDYIILNHAHIDHVGLVPRLYKEGCTAKIIAPIGLKRLYETMVRDSAFIMERDAKDLQEKFKRDFEPIYEEKDVLNSLEYWNEFEKNEVINIDEDIKIRFLNSSHIINSYQSELWVTNSNRTVKIGITSDLGNIALEQYYVNSFQEIEKANLLIGECTYSNEQRGVTKKDRKKDLEKLETVIEQVCIDNKGKILIPVFALQRCQVMLSYLYQIFHERENFDIPIIVDSPLALKVNEVFLQELEGAERDFFKEVLQWKNVKFVKEFTDTQSWVEGDKSCVFLSCGGMLQAGRAVYTATKLLPNSKNHIIFCGYSTTDSLATKIKNKKTKTINIEGKPVFCRCGVTVLKSMTSHMQRPELLNYYSGGNYDKIALVHSNFNDKVNFAKELQNEIFKKNKTNKVIVVNKSTEVCL